MKKRFLFLLLILCFASVSALQAQVHDYTGTYRSGNAPFKEKTKVRITRTDQGYDFVPQTAGNPWSVAVQTIRGAQAGDKGLWFYWFEGDNTLNAFFEVEGGGASALASQIMQDVTNYNQAPIREDEEAKARYDAYFEKAMRESR